MPFINPRRRAVCPRCAQPFRLGQCRVITTTPPDDSLRGPRKYFRGPGEVLEEVPEGLKKVLRLVYIPRLEGPRYAPDRARRECPHCRQPLPERDELLLNGMIFPIGQARTTKSTWITVLIYLLLELQALRDLGIDCFPISEEMETYYWGEYRETLIKNRTPFEPNKPLGPENPDGIAEVWPLVFVLACRRPSLAGRVVPGDSPLRGWRATAWLFRPRVTYINLSLFDPSGEQIPNAREREQYYPQIPEDVGRIIFIDPVVLRKTAPVLIHGYDKDGMTIEEADERLEETCRIIESVAEQVRRWDRRRLRAPTVFLITKSDALEVLDGTIETDLSFAQRNPRPEEYNLAQAMNESAVIEQFIEETRSERLLVDADLFPNHIFQVVSPTGGPVDPLTKKYSSIRPVRALLPLLWILDRRGLLRLPREQRPQSRELAATRVLGDDPHQRPTRVMASGPTPIRPAPADDRTAAGFQPPDDDDGAALRTGGDGAG